LKSVFTMVNRMELTGWRQPYQVYTSFRTVHASANEQKSDFQCEKNTGKSSR